MNRDDIKASPRLATSAVMRYHTWPVLQRQSVAEHTFQSMRIWYEMWGPMPPEVFERMLRHDVGENVTGDLPYGAKRSPRLAEAAEELQNEWDEKILGTYSYSHFEISDEARRKMKICDLAEMLEFGQMEVALGNRLGQPIVDAMSEALWKICSNEEMTKVLDITRRSVP